MVGGAVGLCHLYVPSAQRPSIEYFCFVFQWGKLESWKKTGKWTSSELTVGKHETAPGTAKGHDLLPPTPGLEEPPDIVGVVDECFVLWGEEGEEISAFVLIKAVQRPELRSCRCSGCWSVLRTETTEHGRPGPKVTLSTARPGEEGEEKPNLWPPRNPECHFSWSHGLLLYSWT